MKVLIADKYEESGVASLKEAGCEITLVATLKGAELTAAIGESACDIIVVRSTTITAEMLEASPNLKLVIRAGSGYDTIDVEAATKKNIRVCNCPGMNAVAVAELTLGLMIALDRRIVDQAIDLRKGAWNKKEYAKARGLKGRTLGIVGLGRIGYELAKRCKAFDMNLIYTDVVQNKKAEDELGIRKVELDQILADSDFISLHVPGGGKTKHLIGATELAKMKPTAFVLNCSRGGVIDENALGQALQTGSVGGAGLDVFELEPAAADVEFKDPIVNVSRVYGTHHVGASTDQAQMAVADEVTRIVQTLQKSGDFLHCVNPQG